MYSKYIHMCSHYPDTEGFKIVHLQPCILTLHNIS